MPFILIKSVIFHKISAIYAESIEAFTPTKSAYHFKK